MNTCMYCGRGVDENKIVTIYLNPVDNSWANTKSTPFVVSVSPCCDNELCVLEAWEQVKRSQVGCFECVDVLDDENGLRDDSKEEDVFDAHCQEYENFVEYGQCFLSEKLESMPTHRLSKTLDEEFLRCRRLGHYLEATKIAEELVFLLLDLIEEWKLIYGSANGFQSGVFYRAQQLMKAYVVLRNVNGVDNVMELARKVDRSILDRDCFDLDVFIHDCEKYKIDALVFEKAFNLISNEPGISLARLVSVLSLKGHGKLYHILNRAEDFGFVTGVKTGEGWTYYNVGSVKNRT